MITDLILDRIINKRNFLFLLVFINLFAFLGIYIYVKNAGETITKYPVRYADQIGYYEYLPALLNKDLSFNFMIDESYPDIDNMPRPVIQVNPDNAYGVGLTEIQEGIYANKYPPGVAILISPFFFLAHFVSEVYGLPTTGWDALYQYFCAWGALNYFFLALYLLYKFLRKDFKVLPILVGIFFIIFGTNLFHYATFENLFSHMFSFSFIAYFIYLTDKWYAGKDRVKLSILLGVVPGVIMLLRQANIFVLLYFVFYDLENIVHRIKLLLTNYKYLLLIILSGFITLLPLLIYWKYAYGQFIVFSYTGEGFNFLNPQIGNVLFSIAKGLFFWCPILIFSIPGLFIKTKMKMWLPVVIVLILQTYLISSWSWWQYGESFGHRAFVDIFPFFLIGLVSFLQWLPKKLYILGFALVAINMIQTVQFWLKIIPPADTTWFEYKRTFLKFNEEYRNLWRIERGWE